MSVCLRACAHTCRRLPPAPPPHFPTPARPGRSQVFLPLWCVDVLALGGCLVYGLTYRRLDRSADAWMFHACLPFLVQSVLSGGLGGAVFKLLFAARFDRQVRAGCSFAPCVPCCVTLCPCAPCAPVARVYSTLPTLRHVRVAVLVDLTCCLPVSRCACGCAPVV
jgi:hypothetical protein